jgi:hypothetical protein
VKMCECVCMCVCVCECVNVCEGVYVCEGVSVCVCVCVRVSVSMCGVWVCVYVCESMWMCVWSQRTTLQELVLSFHMQVRGIKLRLGGKCLHVLNECSHRLHTHAFDFGVFGDLCILTDSQ